MTGLLAGALIFLRADVRPAVTTHLRTYTPEQIAESIRMDRKEGPFFTPGLNPMAPLLHAVRWGATNSAPIPAVDGPIVSDTGELTWSQSVTVDTPRTQALIGHAKPSANLSAETSAGFAAITLQSLDASPIAKSTRLLLTANARSANTGMKWNDKRTSTPETGAGGMWIEPVAGAVTLRLDKAKRVEAIPLDGGAAQLSPAIVAEKTPAGWRIPLGSPTLWYLLRVTR